MEPYKKQEDPREKRIREANRALIELQWRRIDTLARYCMTVYEQQWRSQYPHGVTFPLRLDPTIVQFLSGEFDVEDFEDSEKTEQVERLAEAFAMQLRLYRKRLQNSFDVFLCHNSEDKREVRSISNQLKRRGFLPWLDEEELRPGVTWQSKLQREIEAVRSCAVVIGPSGLGPWQKREVEGSLQLFVERNLPTIPVILPSCQTIPELPLFLRSFEWVDFRTLDPDPLEHLIWGISGQKPLD